MANSERVIYSLSLMSCSINKLKPHRLFISKKFVFLILHEKLILFQEADDMIVDVINNKQLSPVVIELFITGKKINISTAFIAQSKRCVFISKTM